MDQTRILRYFIARDGFQGDSEGSTILWAQHPTDPDIYEVWQMKPCGCVQKLDHLTSEEIVVYFISGLWLELDAPDHGGGTIIRMYTRLPEALV